MIATKPFTEVDLLKKQLAEETKEKYALYKRIKELTEEVNMLSEKITLMVIFLFTNERKYGIMYTLNN